MRTVIISTLLVITDIISASNFAIQPYPIDFDQVPLSQTILVGANVSFSCSAAIVDEQTLPQFIWYHNNTEITNGNISYTGINMSTLFISNATKMDQGEYYCIVKDWETRTKSESGKLTVYGDRVKSQHLNVTLNETVVLQCNCDGIQSGKIQWLWNGDTIDLTSKRHHKLQDGGLVILHVNNSDDGVYSCEGTISGGHVKLKSYEIHTVSSSQQINETVLLYPESSTSFFVNMTIVCRIPSSLEFYNVTWIRNGTALSLPTEDVEVVECNLIKIRSMNVSAHEYKCRVYKNSSDEFPATSSSLMTYNYYSVPVVKHSTTDYYICANLNSTDFSCVNGSVQTVNLYCNSVGGTPIPTITWYHNGAEIINANVLNGTLMLNESACDLLGTYQCVVSNEAGSRITVFRVLPFGWPNAPSIPELSTEGRMLYITWKTPMYLGGLNNSLISYKTCKFNFAGLINLHDEHAVFPQEYSCGHTQCNFTILDRDLRNGGMEKFYVSLRIAKTVNMMCQGYNTPDVMISKSSEILFRHVVEYGPPKVNLSCSDEGYAIMTSEPTGSLPAKELEDGRFILQCTADWICTDGTTVIKHQNETLRSTGMCDFNLRVSWRSYNCSVNVTYTYHRGNQKETVLKNCLSNDLDVQNFSSYTQDTASIVLSPTSSVTTTPNGVFQLSSFSESISLVTTSGSVMISVTLHETSSLVMSQATTQLTIQASSSLLPIEDKSSIVGSDLIAATLSLIITLVVITILIIIIGFLIKWKSYRKQRHVNSSGRTLYDSLVSIPKAYSYIGREDQSICENPQAKVVKWINSIDESEETGYIDNELSNEEMLNDLYGVKTIKPVHCNNEKKEDIVDTMHARGGSDDHQAMTYSDDHKATIFADSVTPSTLSSDCACNTYDYKVVTEDHSDNFMVASYTHNSVTPEDDMKYIQVSECQDHSLNAEIQSSTILRMQSQCKTDAYPTHQPIHELTPKNLQDPYPYVPLNFVNTI